MCLSVSDTRHSAVFSSLLNSREGVSIRCRPICCAAPLPSMSTLMSIDVDLMPEVWPLHPCTNLATEASWSWVAVWEIELVSRRSRRKEVLPDAELFTKGHDYCGIPKGCSPPLQPATSRVKSVRGLSALEGSAVAGSDWG